MRKCITTSRRGSPGAIGSTQPLLSHTHTRQKKKADAHRAYTQAKSLPALTWLAKRLVVFCLQASCVRDYTGCGESDQPVLLIDVKHRQGGIHDQHVSRTLRPIFEHVKRHVSADGKDVRGFSGRGDKRYEDARSEGSVGTEDERHVHVHVGGGRREGQNGGAARTGRERRARTRKRFLRRPIE